MAEESSGSNQSTDVDLGVSGLDIEEDSRELGQKTGPDISGSKATIDDGEYSGSKKATGDAGSNGSNQDRFILRQLKFENFVNFEDEQELTFEKNGVYFLVGQNCSGKSSVLEAIRRCMSLRYNSSFSKVAKEADDSIIVCKFKKGEQTLFSFSICKGQSKRKPHETVVCLKGCVVLDEQENVTEFGMDKVGYGKTTGELVSQQLSSTPPDEVFPKMGKSVDLYKFKEWVYKVEEKTMDKQNGDQTRKLVETACENLIKYYIDNIVSTFSLRSFGPLQWSKSEKIERKTENYSEASQRAEIIMWYLQRLKEKRISGSSGDKEERNEERFYEFITNRRGGKYYLKEPQSLTDTLSTAMNVEIMVGKEGRNFPVLKQSMGFIEAKHCSILLAVEEFATVLLEDAGIGMHPQMIDRLGIVLNEETENKVVIISTHSPGFIKSWLIQNIFYFKRTHGGTFKVASGKSLSSNMDLMSVIPGSISSDQFANFCYAETIVFVERPSDIHFIEAMARAMRKQKEDSDVALFSGFQFVSMKSHDKLNVKCTVDHDKMKHLRMCCRVLNKTYAFVLDGNVKEKGCIEEWVRNAIEKEEKEIHTEDRIDQENVQRKTKEELDKFFFQLNSRNIKAMFYTVLDELNIVSAKFDSDTKTIITNCFGTKVKFSKDGANSFRIANIDTIERKSSKVFPNGKETFEERAKLMEYLLDFYEAVDKSELEQKKMTPPIPICEGLCELQDLRIFLTKLHEVRDETHHSPERTGETVRDQRDGRTTT